jgi:ABC-type nitrate/sulfonate/bicarbonate transport system permease component
MFPSRGVWRRPALHPVDLLVFAALLALLFGLLRLAPALNAPFLPKTAPAVVSTDPANLPYYAVRSLLRMFIALVLSVLFTFVYATAAARLRRAEKVLIPVLDILQSVPVLGFLTVTVTAFINLFPGSELGLEFASIFAIFTAMAWNMTFAFYQSLTAQPRDLDEAARIMRLTKWERFWRLDVPSGMIPLVWNGMMSFGGASFFLAASESISVLNHTYALPGIGSYVAAAVGQGDLGHVGFARALAVEPDALLMDEPFSALDVLTAANLRGELTRLWEGKEFPVKAVLIVTHNIEEAVTLADRILVLSSNPGRILAELPVRLPRPRDRQTPGFEQLVDTVYGILTGREEEAARAVEGSPDAPAATPIDVPLPEVSTGGLSGLLEILAARGGQDGLAELADELSFEIDDLLPLVDAAVLLGLARVHKAQLEITDVGREFARADIDTSKKIFGELIAERAPLIKAILRALRATEDGTLREGFFLDLLRRGFSAEEARRQLDIAIEWGRYGELFEYDAETGQLVLGSDPAKVGA